MGIGFQPVRGRWEMIAMPVASTATFQLWAPLDFDNLGNVQEATSTSTKIIGVATSFSTSSYPILSNGSMTNSVIVAIPADNTAVARSNISTSVATSKLSYGALWCIQKVGNNFRIDAGTTVNSALSPLVQLRGNFTSSTSQIDCQISPLVVGIPSITSVTAGY